MEKIERNCLYPFEHWTKIMEIRNSEAWLYAVCINNFEYPASLELHKIYRVIPDEDMRIIDESGGDYLYPADWFVVVELPAAVERSLLQVV